MSGSMIVLAHIYACAVMAGATHEAASADVAAGGAESVDVAELKRRGVGVMIAARNVGLGVCACRTCSACDGRVTGRVAFVAEGRAGGILQWVCDMRRCGGSVRVAGRDVDTG